MRRCATKDKQVFKCPSCGAVIERRAYAGVVCERCHVFMKKVIKSGAFEEIDPDMEVDDGS